MECGELSTSCSTTSNNIKPQIIHDATVLRCAMIPQIIDEGAGTLGQVFGEEDEHETISKATKEKWSKKKKIELNWTLFVVY
ncbi:hypothetical protein H5410_030017 [Solanum commersonii]|uniref:Uncharacterized protein n=1 Tax=Solanum commersonii TaxID=4109 RepID=A0A9J5YFP6_SOLCO|nr:hypothetical protein H5410_030017 [Solanum commersonii]